MTRPKCKCTISYKPPVDCFKPAGADEESQEVKLSPEELEALRLKDVEGLDQTDAAEKMGISQSSFQRILCCARKKTSHALVHGQSIRIAKSDGLVEEGRGENERA
jgi:uncharacterized protein